MRLVVTGTEDVNNLAGWAAKYFGDVPSRGPLSQAPPPPKPGPFPPVGRQNTPWYCVRSMERDSVCQPTFSIHQPDPLLLARDSPS